MAHPIHYGIVSIRADVQMSLFHPARFSLCLAGFTAVMLSGLGGAMAATPGEGLRMTIERPHFTCESGGRTLSRVAYHLHEAAPQQGVLPCCDGQIVCAQFLSTNTVVRPGQRWHS